MSGKFYTKAVVLTLAMILLSTFTGCGASHPSAFAGTWMWDREAVVRAYLWRNTSLDGMELFKDGTGIADIPGGKCPVTWKAENGRFYLTHNESVAVWSYKISGSTLELTNDNGSTATYQKQKK